MKWLSIFLLFLSCSDTILEVEHKIVDSQEPVPFYFGAQVEQGFSPDRWSPVYYYYIYQIEEGDYDAYFHCYLINDDTVMFEGIQKIYPTEGKVVYGEYKPEVDFPVYDMSEVIPMAMIKIEEER
jgi:hypothetical protein